MTKNNFHKGYQIARMAPSLNVKSRRKFLHLVLCSHAPIFSMPWGGCTQRKIEINKISHLPLYQFFYPSPQKQKTLLKKYFSLSQPNIHLWGWFWAAFLPVCVTGVSRILFLCVGVCGGQGEGVWVTKIILKWLISHNLWELGGCFSIHLKEEYPIPFLLLSVHHTQNYL